VGKDQEKSCLEDIKVDGRIILKEILKTWAGGLDWIDLVQDKDMCLDVANAVMNLTVPNNAGKFLNSQGPQPSKRALFHGSVDLAREKRRIYETVMLQTRESAKYHYPFCSLSMR
jgi:hypothetical protein